MTTLSLKFRHGLHALLVNQAFIAVAVATLLGVTANAALFSMGNVLAQPQKFVSSVLSVLALVRFLFGVWSGLTGQDLAMFCGAALLLTLVRH